MSNNHDGDIHDATGIYRRLLTYVKPYKGIFAIAIIAMVFFAATDTGLAAIMKPMLDGSFVEKDPYWIKRIPLLLLFLALSRGIAGFVSSYAMTWIGRGVIKELRRQMFGQILRLPASFYDATSSGQLISKMTFDVEQVAQASTQALTIIVRDTLTIVGLLAWMFYLNWALSLIFLIMGPTIGYLVLYVNKRFRRISTRIQNSMGDVTHVTEESIEGHREIKTFGGQQYEMEHFDKANEYNRRQHMKMAATSAISVQVIMVLASCALAGIVYVTTLPAMLETITVGVFMSFIVAMMMLLSPMKRLTTINVAVQRGIAAAKSLFDLLDAETERDSGTRRVEQINGTVEYRHVSFIYSSDKGMVLDDINFIAEPGQTVAFVGRSGSGKTTLVSLLPRFYEATEGQILIDGQNINDLRLKDLRDKISLVGQDVTLFNDTIKNNIAYGSLNRADEKDIIKAAEAAYAMAFIRDLPDGLETLVGENGVLLSGGQRQRLAIARALLKNSPILILDEATSSLDTESERHIQAALEVLMQHRTTLVIAHRLSTIEKADKIIVMDNGRIIEQGKHAELLDKKSLYATLYNMQFNNPETPSNVSPFIKENAG